MKKLFSSKTDTDFTTILNAARNGDNHAMEVILDASERFAEPLIRSFSQSLDTHTHSDLAHIAKGITHNCIYNYNPDKGCSFKAYANEAIKNRFISMAERAKRIVSIDKGWDDEYDNKGGFDMPEPDSEYSMSRQEERDHARYQIRILIYHTKLSPCEARVINETRRLLENGMKPNDEIIARRLRISHQAVSKSRNSAFSKIRKTAARLSLYDWPLAG